MLNGRRALVAAARLLAVGVVVPAMLVGLALRGTGLVMGAAALVEQLVGGPALLAVVGLGL